MDMHLFFVCVSFCMSKVKTLQELCQTYTPLHTHVITEYIHILHIEYAVKASGLSVHIA